MSALADPVVASAPPIKVWPAVGSLSLKDQLNVLACIPRWVTVSDSAIAAGKGKETHVKRVDRPPGRTIGVDRIIHLSPHIRLIYLRSVSPVVRAEEGEQKLHLHLPELWRSMGAVVPTRNAVVAPLPNTRQASTARPPAAAMPSTLGNLGQSGGIDPVVDPDDRLHDDPDINGSDLFSLTTCASSVAQQSGCGDPLDRYVAGLLASNAPIQTRAFREARTSEPACDCITEIVFPAYTSSVSETGRVITVLRTRCNIVTVRHNDVSLGRDDEVSCDCEHFHTSLIWRPGVHRADCLHTILYRVCYALMISGRLAPGNEPRYPELRSCIMGGSGIPTEGQRGPIAQVYAVDADRIVLTAFPATEYDPVPTVPAGVSDSSSSSSSDTDSEEESALLGEDPTQRQACLCYMNACLFGVPVCNALICASRDMQALPGSMRGCR